MGKLPLSHRSTRYPCFVPNLGESMGAGRKGLTHGKGSKKSGSDKPKSAFECYQIDCQNGKIA